MNLKNTLNYLIQSGIVVVIVVVIVCCLLFVVYCLLLLFTGLVPGIYYIRIIVRQF